MSNSPPDERNRRVMVHMKKRDLPRAPLDDHNNLFIITITSFSFNLIDDSPDSKINRKKCEWFSLQCPWTPRTWTCRRDTWESPSALCKTPLVSQIVTRPLLEDPTTQTYSRFHNSKTHHWPIMQSMQKLLDTFCNRPINEGHQSPLWRIKPKLRKQHQSPMNRIKPTFDAT